MIREYKKTVKATGLNDALGRFLDFAESEIGYFNCRADWKEGSKVERVCAGEYLITATARCIPMLTSVK